MPTLYSKYLTVFGRCSKGEGNPCLIKREFVKAYGNNIGKYFRRNILKGGGTILKELRNWKSENEYRHFPANLQEYDKSVTSVFQKRLQDKTFYVKLD